jgi:hypothetical protein
MILDSLIKSSTARAPKTSKNELPDYPKFARNVTNVVERKGVSCSPEGFFSYMAWVEREMVVRLSRPTFDTFLDSDIKYFLLEKHVKIRF